MSDIKADLYEVADVIVGRCKESDLTPRDARDWAAALNSLAGSIAALDGGSAGKGGLMETLMAGNALRERELDLAEARLAATESVAVTNLSNNDNEKR